MNEQITLSAAIVAVVQVLKGLLPQAVTGWITPVIAGALGAAWALINGTDVIAGIVAGLAASGAVTVAERVGQRSSIQ